MAKPKKRDNAYWKARIKRENAAMFDRVEAGEISVRSARIELGLMRQPTALDNLKRAWKATTTSQRKAFIAWAKGLPAARPSGTGLVDTDGLLKPSVVTRVHHIMRAKYLKHGDIMAAMGYRKLDPRLGFALARRHRLPLDFFDRLAKWLSTISVPK